MSGRNIFFAFCLELKAGKISITKNSLSFGERQGFLNFSTLIFCDCFKVPWVLVWGKKKRESRHE